MKKTQGSNLPRTLRRPRVILQELYGTAVRAVQPSALLMERVKISRNSLVIASQRGSYSFPLGGKIFVAGAGKGVDLTAPIWENLLNDRLEEGVLVVRDPLRQRPTKKISVLEGGHPLP